jgi:hypothetical protein
MSTLRHCRDFGSDPHGQHNLKALAAVSRGANGYYRVLTIPAYTTPERWIYPSPCALPPTKRRTLDALQTIEHLFQTISL